MIDKISPTIRKTLLRKSFYENDDEEDENEEEDGSGDRNESDYEDDE